MSVSFELQYCNLLLCHSTPWNLSNFSLSLVWWGELWDSYQPDFLSNRLRPFRPLVEHFIRRFEKVFYPRKFLHQIRKVWPETDSPRNFLRLSAISLVCICLLAENTLPIENARRHSCSVGSTTESWKKKLVLWIEIYYLGSSIELWCWVLMTAQHKHLIYC